MIHLTLSQFKKFFFLFISRIYYNGSEWASSGPAMLQFILKFPLSLTQQNLKKRRVSLVDVQTFYDNDDS